MNTSATVNTGPDATQVEAVEADLADAEKKERTAQNLTADLRRDLDASIVALEEAAQRLETARRCALAHRRHQLDAHTERCEECATLRRDGGVLGLCCDEATRLWGACRDLEHMVGA